jgi:hypothetical protein
MLDDGVAVLPCCTTAVRAVILRSLRIFQGAEVPDLVAVVTTMDPAEEVAASDVAVVTPMDPAEEVAASDVAVVTPMDPAEEVAPSCVLEF